MSRATSSFCLVVSMLGLLLAGCDTTAHEESAAQAANSALTSCSGNCDCPLNSRCVGGTCRVGAGSAHCYSDCQCPFATFCRFPSTSIAGTCVAEPDHCANDCDCAPNDICNDPGTAGSFCGVGFSPPASCNCDSHCPGGQHCVGGGCV